VSEGIDLPELARGSLLPEAERVARLDLALPQILAAVEGESDAIVVQATLACLLWEAMPQTSWCGFYRRVGEKMLAVGPYQGTMGCLRIAFDRGVCGAAARTKTAQLVHDIRKRDDHIACDDATLSELVLPVFAPGSIVQAVLDLDARMVGGFSAAESARLESLLAKAFGPAVEWPARFSA
jgi:GAF domain-containing protein